MTVIPLFTFSFFTKKIGRPPPKETTVATSYRAGASLSSFFFFLFFFDSAANLQVVQPLIKKKRGERVLKRLRKHPFPPDKPPTTAPNLKFRSALQAPELGWHWRDRANCRHLSFCPKNSTDANLYVFCPSPYEPPPTPTHSTLPQAREDALL